MRRRMLRHGIVLLVGVVFIAILSRDMWPQLRDLSGHLRSGDWEISTDRGAIEQIVRSKYSDSSEWQINFVAGSGQAFLLDAPGRRETVMLLGQQSLSDAANIRFNSVPLQTAYSGFMSRAVLDLVLDPAVRNPTLLRALAGELEALAGRSRRQIDAGVYARAQAALRLLPRTDTLRRALSDFDELGPSRDIDFPAYEVLTSPSFEAPGAWEGQAQTLPQVGKCRASVSPRSDSSSQVTANFSLLPRLLEVSIIRPWMSDALLDQAVNQASQSTRQYFQDRGALRVIPARFWVLMPELAWIEPVGSSERGQIAAWGRENTCCRIVCNNATYDLLPSSFRENRDATYFAHRSDVQPLLYAVVSRRRIAP